ncbi:MAG: exosome complex protein Rrp42 [Methanobrevibacter sp.]|nr:exosome complex protein Rrp42 [Methanobrevibacter sp.]
MMNIIPEITRESITYLINNDQREDGRSFDEYRDIVIEPGIISKAEGSARVKIGKTQVIVGIKPQLGEPFPDTPNVGVLMTNGEMLPMADPSFEPGPPSEASVELARVVDRGIRESEMVDLEKLCIAPGKKVWMLFIDLHIIDFDGNLFDTATLAVLSALKNTKIPVAKMEGDEVVIDEENTMDLPIRNETAMCTFVKIGDKMILDPALSEESILEARLSIGITKSGGICAMQKGGDASLTKENILDAVKIAYSKVPDLLKKVESA